MGRVGAARAVHEAKQAESVLGHQRRDVGAIIAMLRQNRAVSRRDFSHSPWRNSCWSSSATEELTHARAQQQQLFQSKACAMETQT